MVIKEIKPEEDEEDQEEDQEESELEEEPMQQGLGEDISEFIGPTSHSQAPVLQSQPFEQEQPLEQQVANAPLTSASDSEQPVYGTGNTPEYSASYEQVSYDTPSREVNVDRERDITSTRMVQHTPGQEQDQGVNLRQWNRGMETVGQDSGSSEDRNYAVRAKARKDSEKLPFE